MDKKIIEYGKDTPNDKSVYREVERITEIGNNRETVTITGVRNRIIDPNIPETDKGHVTYTEWEVIDKQVKNERI